MNRQFYTELLPDENYYKLIWSKKDKRSHWFKNTDQLIEYINQHTEEDLFIGLCTTQTRLPSKARVVKENVSTIRAFHIDIDIVDPIAHTSAKYPETLEEALKIAHSLIEPTYIIHSGHGIHAYYFFDEHCIISDPDYWTMFSQQFQYAIREKFPQYHLDSTYDLPRVLRCPGTLNCKDPENLLECKIIEHNKTAYYTETEIDDAIGFDPQRVVNIPSSGDSDDNEAINGKSKLHRNLTKRESIAYMEEHGLVLNPDAEIPSQKIYNLNVIEPRFQEEFHERTNRKSPSDYDMVLANIGAKNGFSEQEIFDLMIHYRRHHGHHLKLNRQDYYMNTMNKAIARYKVEKIEKKKPDELSSNDKEVIREWLYSVLDIQVYRLVRYKRSPNYYFEIELSNCPGVSIHLGNIQDGIFAQRAFLGKIAAHTLEVSKSVKAERWSTEIVPKLLRLVEDGVSPETATHEGQVIAWAKEFFHAKTVIESYEEFKANKLYTQSFFHENRIFFSYEAMCQWITTSKAQRIDTFHFAVAMSKLGFSQERILDAKGFELQMWASPRQLPKSKDLGLVKA